MNWGDVELKIDDNGTEFLEFNEKLSKTRTGELKSGVREFKSKIFAVGTDQCPI